MSHYYCLDIEFPDVEFKSYYKNSEIEKIHHAHLYPDKDEIELKIFYDEETYFGENLAMWAKEIDWDKFGSFLRVEISSRNSNKRLQKVDLSKAKLLGSTISTNYYEGNQKYTIVRIDTAKFYWNPNEHAGHTAEFYLDSKGFRLVEPFYSVLTAKLLFKNDGNFNIGRMIDSKKFYKLGKSTFRPEFNFVTKDNRKQLIAEVIKEPKIQFKYIKSTTEEEVFFYSDVVLMLASFYFHIKIDYTFRRIHLPEYTIEIKHVEQKKFIDTTGSLRGFEIYWDFNKFLLSGWQKETLKNFTLLSKVVALFNQSHMVDSSSEFLILYNIIEICDRHKSMKEKFTKVLNKSKTKTKQNEALTKLLETIEPSEHDEFKKRWQNVQSLLQYKPMKNQLFSFLESQGLEPNNLPIKINELKELRDNITHGSIEKVNTEQLKKANTLLYRISGILILNLMGLDNWKLNLTI